VKDAIDRDIVPAIGRVPLVAVNGVVAGRPVSRVVERGARVHAGRVLQLTKQMFAFGAARDFLMTNPAASLRADDFGIVVSLRDRHLATSEIPIVLAGIEAGNIGPTLRHGLVLLFFTGLRTHEALTLEWTDVDLDAATVTVRPDNQKVTFKRLRAGKVKPYVVPLSAPALAAVKALRALAPNGARWVFYSPSPRAKLGRVEGSSLGNALRRVVAADERLSKLAKFSPHIFRHTLATHMTETLKLAPWLGQLCLGHALGSMLGSSVADRYDQAQLLPDRRAALNTYATWIEGMCAGSTAKVIPMAEAGRG
jgi:integrase